MASVKEIKTEKLLLPVLCKCSNCGAVNKCTVSFSVTGEGIYGGSPFGRQERALKDAENHLKQNMRYHIMKLYEEADIKPERFVRYFIEDACEECGQMFPWKTIEEATIEDSDTRVKGGLLPGLFSLSSKKFKTPSEKVKDSIRAIPKENLPYPAMEENEFVEQLGLSGVDSESPDATALFMHL